MKKSELIDQIAQDADISKAAAGQALDALLAGIIGALKGKDGKVILTGFGTFEKVHRKARTGRNPKTGEAIKIKASNVVKFKQGCDTVKSWLNWAVVISIFASVLTKTEVYGDHRA
jgi:DNA-binding protein HU-beta